MISLHEWLILGKKYSEDEAEETLLRLEAGMELSAEVKKDVREYTEDYIAWISRK
ncbi:MAG: hypothetical protein J6S67_24260 [Methanobrevibacter sp.]|nr:hypothetical protein [Methanobrevibacter sp.]